MSITPLPPAENSKGEVKTWVKSQRKFPQIPGHFSAEINKVEAERDAIRAQVELLHGAMLRVQVRIGQPCILEKLNSVRSIVNAALAKSTGSPDGQQ